MLDSEALTKLYSAILAAVVLVAAVGGSAYVLWRASLPPPEDIRIGVCADLDNAIGRGVWRAAVLAAEQVNAEGGVLGRNFTIVAEDDDDESARVDLAVLSNAITKLITVDKADFVVCAAVGSAVYAPQDICAEHKKIYLGVRGALDNITQRVVDDYERYKYYFKLWSTNSSTSAAGILDSTVGLCNLTGLKKVAFLGVEGTASKQTAAMLNSSLPKYGLSLVYSNMLSASTEDFTSILAAVEASGAELLVPAMVNQAAIPFVKEWYDRESPFVIKGSLTIAQESNFWELTEGKCEYVSFTGVPALSGYPLTNKTVATRDAYLQRWGTTLPSAPAVAAYDGLRFILPDAIRRAGTIETEAVVKALEATDVETSMARHFVFTTSHDIFVGAAGVNILEEDYLLVANFQYQSNGSIVPIYPLSLMRETGTTYRFPPWAGPWGNRQTAG